MLFRIAVLFLLCVWSGVAATIEDALRLMRENSFPAAKTVLSEVVAAEPENAQACYLLGIVTAQGKEPKAMEESLVWLEKASKLAPTNPDYWSTYGQQLMAHAARHTSFSSASKGREALEKALKIQPNNFNARATLYEYYERAPWPIGSSSKANAQLDELRKIDPERTFTLLVRSKMSTKKFGDAFQACEERLAKKPDDPLALFHYGRAAAVSGQNLQKGIEHLQRYIQLAPTFKDAPTLANAWGRIGNIEEKRGNPAAARAAYETMLKLEPENPSAKAALASLNKAAAP
jgi:cytochrome c-type biogenesis protein CcmH/NrfG